MAENLGVFWPQIKVGELVTRPCPEGKHGEMTWRCTGKGWKGKFPDTSDCVSPWLNSIDQLVRIVNKLPNLMPHVFIKYFVNREAQ